MSTNIVEKLKKLDNIFDKEDLFFKYMKLINKDWYDHLDIEYLMMNRSQKEEFFEDIEKNGIYIHQQPFFGNTPMSVFEKIFIEMPDIVEKYKFVNIEKPMVMGDIYFIRLLISLLSLNCGKLLRA